MTLSILIVGALLVMQNDGFTVGMLVAFQMFASRMSQPLLRLVGLWQEFQQANIAVKRLGDILDMPQEPHTLTPTRENQGPGRIDLSHLAFRYSEHHPWLYRNLSLTLKPGHLTVLMGPSGSGKSTLAKLLLGFYQPNEGQINLDGKDIRHLAANELRQKPRFYNTLTSNCTTIVFELARVIAPALPMDYRLLLSGYFARYVYDLHGLTPGYRYDELQALGHINERALASDVSEDDFSMSIRQGVPGIPANEVNP